MSAGRVSGGATPGSGLANGGAGGVGDAKVPEGEDTGRAGAGPGGGGAAGQGDRLLLATGGGGHVTVAPRVGDDCAGGVHAGGAPRCRGVGVCALVVRHATVDKGEDARGARLGAARVGDPLAGRVAKVEGGAEGEAGGEEEEGSHCWNNCS